MTQAETETEKVVLAPFVRPLSLVGRLLRGKPYLADPLPTAGQRGTLWRSKFSRKTLYNLHLYNQRAAHSSMPCKKTNMKRLIALAVVIFASQAVATFAGEPVVSSKQVIAPPPPPPVSFFRGNEFDIGAFATYVTGTNGGGTRQTTFDDGTTFTLSSSRSPHGWGGGMDFTYFFPWKYAGVRFQGAGVALTSGNVTVTDTTVSVGLVQAVRRQV